ncbi:deaminase [Paraliomyxa miuraensis]|uniref:deaminase n=1 Tax=Paraliomyxa miuraensis TaxID=376150 RepID=UPI0022582973|nr:deaminase [Paraliomyxa miuraensis]MCX4241402.1 deaminase [Paraliomyxa miuraensis]
MQKALSDGLREHGYGLEVLVRISEHLDEMRQAPQDERPAARQERLMEAGTHLRREHGGDYLALMAIAHINATREIDEHDEVLPHQCRGHLIRSLKHPDEVTRLRHVYGKGFFLLGVSAPRSLRCETLIKRNFPLDEANRLLDKDAAEDEKIGQQTRETFQLADAYLWVDGDDGQRIGHQVRRILDLLFSCPFHPPTPEEHAMFMAYAAALRSSDLSRQVGAVVANRLGDVVASGANEAPAPNGGTYWPSRVEFDGSTDELAGPDYLRGYDSNERERNRILARVITKLVPEEARDEASGDGIDDLSPGARSALIAKYKDRLEGTGILDLTEFGRAVHAEMAALMSCARSGVTPVGGTLYCTTFPCHNCAKHIIASGITRVVYVEPYAKSKAKDLHTDAIVLPLEDERRWESQERRVEFRAFEGIGPRRFVDLFSLTLGSGRPVRRKKKGADGAREGWERGEGSLPRLPLDSRSYLEREDACAKYYRRQQPGDGKL